MLLPGGLFTVCLTDSVDDPQDLELNETLAVGNAGEVVCSTAQVAGTHPIDRGLERRGVGSMHEIPEVPIIGAVEPKPVGPCVAEEMPEAVDEHVEPPDSFHCGLDGEVVVGNAGAAQQAGADHRVRHRILHEGGVRLRVFRGTETPGDGQVSVVRSNAHQQEDLSVVRAEAFGDSCIQADDGESDDAHDALEGAREHDEHVDDDLGLGSLLLLSRLLRIHDSSSGSRVRLLQRFEVVGRSPPQVAGTRPRRGVGALCYAPRLSPTRILRLSRNIATPVGRPRIVDVSRGHFLAVGNHGLELWQLQQAPQGRFGRAGAGEGMRQMGAGGLDAEAGWAARFENFAEFSFVSTLGLTE
mmetsp:Transcript_21986/g.52819  ORF Transcript_21986/g.52819 Transcript_21986/m.52819 type:complete len:356 (+) Transcript_21986:1474-2541(+)